MLWGLFNTIDFPHVYNMQRHKTKKLSTCCVCVFCIGRKRGWRPRSSWMLLSSHPVRRPIQALKRPSELLKRAEVGWEFLSQWTLLEDINFYCHFVRSPVYSSELVRTRFFFWVARRPAFESQRWKWKWMQFFKWFWRCFVFVGVVCLYVWDMCEKENVRARVWSVG